MVLIPSQKWTYFEDNWDPNWVRAGKKTVRELWQSQYKSTEVIIPPFETQLIKTGFASGKQKRQDKHQFQMSTLGIVRQSAAQLRWIQWPGG
jgi:hypothetical protein